MLEGVGQDPVQARAQGRLDPVQGGDVDREEGRAELGGYLEGSKVSTCGQAIWLRARTGWGGWNMRQWREKGSELGRGILRRDLGTFLATLRIPHAYGRS